MPKELAEIQEPEWFGWLAWGLGKARRLPVIGTFWHYAKCRATKNVLHDLHDQLLHRLRRLAPAVADFDSEYDAAHLATQVCTESRRIVSAFLELGANDLHACIKLLKPPLDEGDSEGWRVATWVRSEPEDDRPFEQGDYNAHKVSANTVWSALLGENDGKEDWRPYCCFACNDLRENTNFMCDRDNWRRYYRSVLVFPIRYVADNVGEASGIIGFLAFDSPKKNAFPGLPDIMATSDDPAAFRQKLEKHAIFHLGAIIADTLGAVLREAHKSNNDGEGGES